MRRHRHWFDKPTEKKKKSDNPSFFLCAVCVCLFEQHKMYREIETVIIEREIKLNEVLACMSIISIKYPFSEKRKIRFR